MASDALTAALDQLAAPGTEQSDLLASFPLDCMDVDAGLAALETDVASPQASLRSEAVAWAMTQRPVTPTRKAASSSPVAGDMKLDAMVAEPCPAGPPTCLAPDDNTDFPELVPQPCPGEPLSGLQLRPKSGPPKPPEERIHCNKVFVF